MSKKPTTPIPTAQAAIDAAIDQAKQNVANPAPAPALPQELQAALQTVANVCDSAPVSGPAHRAWQQALDRIAQALLAAQKA